MYTGVMTTPGPLEQELEKALDEAEFAVFNGPAPKALGPGDPGRFLLAEAQLGVALDFIRRCIRERDNANPGTAGNGSR